MSIPLESSGIDSYYQAILQIQERVIRGQRQVLTQVASVMADTIRQGRRIFIFGTGHSHMLAEEAFYRAGGLAACVPIFSAALMLHDNPDLASRLERTPGLAEKLLERYAPEPGEMIFIFSNSGVNHMPVEMALLARERGLFVVSVSSLEYSRIAPLSALGKRLDEIADIAIDNGCPPGDAIIPLEGLPWRVAPGTTVVTSMIWNALVAETAVRLQAAGITPPVFVSFNLQTPGEHNRLLIEAWGRLNPHFQVLS